MNHLEMNDLKMRDLKLKRSVMSFHRALVVAVATLFSVGMTSIASASCCGWGYSAPVAYAVVAPAAYGGCGACGAPTAAAVYAQPVAPAPIYVNPVAPTSFGGPCCSYSGCGNCGWSDWSSGCGSCGISAAVGCGNCGVSAWGGGGGGCGCAPVAYAAPYVVNQGPVYSGPAIMAYQTYSPEAAYVPATDYPYAPGAGYGYGYRGAPPYAGYYRHPYYRPRVAYRGPYVHRYYGAPHRRYYR
ncbi:MAG: hypothetical protein WBD71_19985 [Xanthobacteraceae bacterium]